MSETWQSFSRRYQVVKSNHVFSKLVVICVTALIIGYFYKF